MYDSRLEVHFSSTFKFAALLARYSLRSQYFFALVAPTLAALSRSWLARMTMSAVKFIDAMSVVRMAFFLFTSAYASYRICYEIFFLFVAASRIVWNLENYA